MSDDEKKRILEYAQLGLKLLPRGGKPQPITEAERSRMAAIREEFGMAHVELLQKALAVLGPIADSEVYPDEPVNARSRARVELAH